MLKKRGVPMMKLLFAISQLYKGGAETALINLFHYLDYKKYEVELVILNQIPSDQVVSLLEQVNKKVTICDAYAEFQKISLVDRLRAKVMYTMEQKSAYYFTALDFVRGKEYDCAFWIGEWVLPSFVAYHVNAKRKVAWLHTDIAKAKYFDGESYFSFDDCMDDYIFVSNHSYESSVQKYPFLEGKSDVIPNLVNIAWIREKSCEAVTDFRLKEKIPVVLTCANIREEKNHLRQVKVMAELKKKGILFYWINIGSTADQGLVSKIHALCKKEKLESYFFLIGARENPYKYMKMADVVAVLSDFESWSLVITEAKILGIPVIATKTSGALEQIEDRKTGILTEFSEKDIAKHLEELLQNQILQTRIRNNLKGFDITDQVLKKFDEFLKREKKEKKDILYIIDDINYLSGAHSATIRQIKALLKQGRAVTVFSNTIPKYKIRKELAEVLFHSWMSCFWNRIYLRRMIDCVTDKALSKEIKRKKVEMCYRQKIKKDETVWEKVVLASLVDFCSQYAVVAVMSEASAFRKVVADSNCKNKIQWIHTDYCRWREFSDWTREITKNDEQIYQHYHTVVVLSEQIKLNMITLFPSLADKIEVSQNLMPVETIIEKAEVEKVSYPPVHFITVGRLSSEKAYDRLIQILIKLKKKGYQFLWEIVGDGPERENLKAMIKNNEMEKEIILLGQQENPYFYIKKAQIFALLSTYEGMPNTIYEALILGVPVLATDVGGISEQFTDGVNGWLVENTEKEIMEKIAYLMEHQKEIAEVKKNAEKYHYENERINEKLSKIFSTI